MTRQEESDDVFWNIALQNDTDIVDIDSNDTNENDDEWLHPTASLRDNHTYEVNITPYGHILLNLIPLSIVVQDNDAMIPLGAEAWYGSALLAAMFEQIVRPDTIGSCNTDSTRLLQTYLRSYLQHGNCNINILELGSGAIGLASLVAGLSVTGYMHQYRHQQQQQSSNFAEPNIDHAVQSSIHCRVILTDFEPTVLQQLEHNVHTTTSSLENQYWDQYPLPEFVVQHLNWENISEFQYDNHNHALQLMIGSELVYNVQTARSCAKTIIQLLQANPNVLVIIVNNANREGWDTTFLSTIYKTLGIRYVLEALNNSHLHNVASNFIRPGGTLNPCTDFSVLYVWQEQQY